MNYLVHSIYNVTTSLKDWLGDWSEDEKIVLERGSSHSKINIV